MFQINHKFAQLIAIIVGITACSVSLINLQTRELSKNSTAINIDDFIEQEKNLQSIIKLQRKIPVFDFQNLFSDWIYLQFIQYFGDTEARKVTGYSVVTDYFEIVVNRDPNFIQSHLAMSSANSLFAARPEKTVGLINQALESVTPENPYYPFFLWTYKATDEILFLGDIEAAKNSYEMAAKWASLRQDDLGNEMAGRYQNTVKFLSSNPDPTEAQYGAWMNILSNSQDRKTQDYILNKLRDLGAEIEIDSDGRIQVKSPSQT